MHAKHTQESIGSVKATVVSLVKQGKRQNSLVLALEHALAMGPTSLQRRPAA